MTEGPLLTTILYYSLPLMISSTLQLVFNAADTIVVGQFAGNLALAAVGSVGSLYNMIISLFIGLSIGVNVLVANYSGANLPREVSDTVHTAILLSVVGGLLLGIIGFFASRPLLQLMGTPDDVIDLAVIYTRIIFVGLPVTMLYNFASAVLRAIGDTKRPLYFLTIAGVVNVILNLIFVILFHMSVAGVALATIISQTISAILVTRSLLYMDGPTRLYLKKLRIHGNLLRRIITIGLPAGVQSMMFSISNVVIQSSVNSFGSIVVAGNAAAANVGNFVYQSINTFQQSVTSFAGQNLGARKPGRVITSLKVCLFWTTVFGIVLGPLATYFSRPLLGLFSSDPDVISVGIERMQVVVLPYALCGVMDVMTGVLRGIGYSTLPMIVSLMGACVFRLIWIATIFRANHSMFVLMLSYPVSWTLTFIVLVGFFCVLWKKVKKRFTEQENNAG
ncbi:MAG: MATE family efflux transporter [Clostridia bacterium]|nr:MATE family efflux transporter [Clostridia bacterium]